MASEALPSPVESLCDEFGLARPSPGERWTFHLEDVPDDRDIGRELVSAGGKLKQELADEDGGRRYEYVIPEPGWPDPLGYVTTDDPQWVGPQHRWRSPQKFYGNVRGTIPDPGDCGRHPDLPPDAYALSTVFIYGPEKEPKFHAKTSLEVSDGAWTVNLTYEQVDRGYGCLVEVYSGELGSFPECTKWRSSHAGNDERRRVEFFDSPSRAIAFVERKTGLRVPSRPNSSQHGGEPDGE